MNHIAYLSASCLISLCILIGCSNEETAPALPNVAVVQVLQADVPLYQELVGQTFGSIDVAIRARVDGQLEGLHFREGGRISKGDLLYSIDPRPFEIKILGAEGELTEAKTKLQKAQADYSRIAPLAKIAAVSQRDLDAAVAERNAAQASVETAQAKLDYTKVELGYTKIHSPIDGIIGISNARVGDYVGKEPNPVVLNTVSQVHPIHVRVSLSEREYLTFARRLRAKDSIDQPAQPKNSEGELALILADGSIHPHPGRITAVNNQIDPSTGTLTIEAAFPNPSGLLRPGQFAKIRYIQETKQNVLLVWQRAVRELQDIFQVLTVDSENRVQVHAVEVGEKIDGLWIIENGLFAGDRVIVEGMQRVRPSMIVNPLSPEELNVAVPESALLSQILAKKNSAATE